MHHCVSLPSGSTTVMQEPDLIIELDIVLLQVVHLARDDTQLVLYVAPGWAGDESSSLSLSLNNGQEKRAVVTRGDLAGRT